MENEFKKRMSVVLAFCRDCVSKILQLYREYFPSILGVYIYEPVSVTVTQLSPHPPQK